jgi:hypothetical protein
MTAPRCCRSPVGSTWVAAGTVRQWQELASYHLDTTREPDALVLRFRDYAGVYGQLRMLAAPERDCCPFLVFDVTRGNGPAVVRITAAPNLTPTWRRSSIG